MNTAREAGRATSVRQRYETDCEARTWDQSGVDDGLVSTESGNRILGFVRDLPEQYREPLVLRVMQGLQSRQIAEILGISEAAVDTRVARARAQLRERMERDADGHESNSASVNNSHVPEAQGVNHEPRTH